MKKVTSRCLIKRKSVDLKALSTMMSPQMLQHLSLRIRKDLNEALPTTLLRLILGMQQ